MNVQSVVCSVQCSVCSVHCDCVQCECAECSVQCVMFCVTAQLVVQLYCAEFSGKCTV